jgi:hypothetical protein
MSSRIHCTILARNYLPSALALADSLRRHRNGTPLVVFLTDATPATELPEIEGVRWMGPASLELPERTALELAMSYDLVEFATALKPLVLQALLRDHDQVVYLDPDTYLVSEMAELESALAEGPIVLTPHFLEPPPPGNHFAEGHLLHVGVYNLGFCAVNRSAETLLRWWWSHLRSECLHDPLSGLFVDQKWMDVGSVLFGAAVLRHRGYNVGAGNVHERELARDDDGLYIRGTGDRLRLFHFHAFDPARPESLYNRLRTRVGGAMRADNDVLRALCREYAEVVIVKRRQLGPQPPYVYATDTTGRPISRHIRRAYRVASLANPGTLPSPFIPEEAGAYERWRRSALMLAGRLTLSDLAKSLRCALPDEYDALKRRFPGLLRRLRGRYLEETGLWG